MTGRRLSKISGRHGRSGPDCLGFWAGRARSPGRWGIFTWLWFRKCYYSDRRRGWCLHAPGGHWETFNTGWYSDLWGERKYSRHKGVGTTPQWKYQWQRQDWRRWIHTLPDTRKSITVHHDQNDHGYLSGGGVPPWGAGVPEVVVTGEPGLGGDAGGGNDRGREEEVGDEKDN